MHRILQPYYIYLAPLLLSAILSLKSFWLKWPKPFRIISIFLWVTVLLELMSIGWKWFFHVTPYWQYTPNNHWIYGIGLPLRFGLLFLFFYSLLETARIRKWTKVLAAVFMPFSIINYFFIQGPFATNSFTIILAHFIIIFLSLYYFWELVRSEQFKPLRNNPAVLICLGLFLYHSSTLPYFISIEAFSGFLARPVGITYMFIHQAFNIIMYSLFLTAYLCKIHPRTSD